jgi:hypothetical protein
MYDIEITANIIRTINEREFIDELNQVVRVLIILALLCHNNFVENQTDSIFVHQQKK